MSYLLNILDINNILITIIINVFSNFINEYLFNKYNIVKKNNKCKQNELSKNHLIL